jgi:hypothetical protein
MSREITLRDDGSMTKPVGNQQTVNKHIRYDPHGGHHVADLVPWGNLGVHSTIIAAKCFPKVPSFLQAPAYDILEKVCVDDLLFLVRGAFPNQSA